MERCALKEQTLSKELKDARKDAPPPRIPRALLRWILPRSDRDRLLGELDDLWYHRCVRGRSSGLWYWRQAAGFLLRLKAYRPSHAGRIFRGLLEDVRFSLRRLGKRPVMAVVIVVTLGTVIGANTAVFTSVDAVLLAPLPYDASEELWRLWAEDPETPDPSTRLVSLAVLRAWEEGATPFTSIAYAIEGSMTLTEQGAPELVEVNWISPEMFSLLGVFPILGRSFTSEEYATSDEGVIVLSHAFWTSRLNRDRDVLGTTLRLNGNLVTIVGVMPSGFRFPMDSEVIGWMPVDAGDQEGFLFEWPLYSVIGRTGLKVDSEAVIAALSPLMPTVSEPRFADARPAAIPLYQESRPDDRGLLALMGIVSLVMLVGALNVSEFLVASGADRRGELAVRRALGGSGRRVGQLIAAEVSILALLGGLAAVGVSAGLVRWFSFLDPGVLPGWADMGLNRRTMIFTIAATGLAAIAMGLVPILRAARSDTGRGPTARAGLTRRDSRWIGALLAVQASAAVVVIAGGMLLYRGWAEILSSDPGFEPTGAVVGMIQLPGDRYHPADGVGQIQFFDALQEELRNRPGVVATGVATAMPLSSGLDFAQLFSLPGEVSPSIREIDTRTIGGEYFRATGIELLSGRPPDSTDRNGTPLVAVLNETAVSLLAPSIPPGEIIGHILTELDADRSRVTAEYRVIGVVSDTKEEGLDRASRPIVYLPYLQSRPFGRMWVGVRHTGSASQALDQLRTAVAAVDPELPLIDADILADRALRSVASRRFNLYLLGAMAVVALALALVGSVGLVSFSLTGRRREMGIRIAVGATAADVRSNLLAVALKPLLFGTLFGVSIAYVASRVLGSAVPDFGKIGWLDLASATALLLISGALCALAAANRASDISPRSVLTDT